jgi:hypothetical protein
MNALLRRIKRLIGLDHGPDTETVFDLALEAACLLAIGFLSAWIAAALAVLIRGVLT